VILTTTPRDATPENGSRDSHHHTTSGYLRSLTPRESTVALRQLSARDLADADTKESPMRITQLTHTLVGLLIMVENPQRHDERGLSQSAENAILIAGAVAVAVAIVAAIRAFVLSRLPS
jgi:hypothetical protein